MSSSESDSSFDSRSSGSPSPPPALIAQLDRVPSPAPVNTETKREDVVADQPRKPRKVKPKTCDQCKKRKIKCLGAGKVCKNCNAKGIECTRPLDVVGPYNEATRNTAEAPASELSQAREEIARLKEMVEQLAQQVQAQSHRPRPTNESLSVPNAKTTTAQSRLDPAIDITKSSVSIPRPAGPFRLPSRTDSTLADGAQALLSLSNSPTSAEAQEASEAAKEAILGFMNQIQQTCHQPKTRSVEEMEAKEIQPKPNKIQRIEQNGRERNIPVTRPSLGLAIPDWQRLPGAQASPFPRSAHPNYYSAGTVPQFGQLSRHAYLSGHVTPVASFNRPFRSPGAPESALEPSPGRRNSWTSHIYFESILPENLHAHELAELQLQRENARLRNADKARLRELKAAHEARYDNAVSAMMKSKAASQRANIPIGGPVKKMGETSFFQRRKSQVAIPGAPVGENIVLGALRNGMVDAMLGGIVAPSPVTPLSANAAAKNLLSREVSNVNLSEVAAK